MARDPFEALDRVAGSGDAGKLIQGLISLLEEQGQYKQLYEALMMDRRRELGLPLVGEIDPDALPEEVRAQLGRGQIEACRQVGKKFLERGDIVSAWPYFRTINEPAPVAQAIERWAKTGREERQPAFDAVIDVAFGHGVHPTVALDTVLADRGTCAAITLLERGFPFGRELRLRCAASLLRHFHRELVESLRREIDKREGSAPDTEDVGELIDGRPWLFADNACHLDESHLRSVIRFSIVLTDPGDLQLASQLCFYGSQLSRNFHRPDPPPFEQFYFDYSTLLTAITGHQVDEAVKHFRGKLAQQQANRPQKARFPAEVLVYLQHRASRPRQAIDTYLEYLKHTTEPGLCPSLRELCQAAGDYTPLLELSRERKNLIEYAATLAGMKGDGF